MRKMTQARRDYLKDPAKRQHVEFAKAVGGVHSIEVKRGKGSGLWHPHVHMIWLCHEAPDQAKLRQEWEGWAGIHGRAKVVPFHSQEDLIGDSRGLQIRTQVLGNGASRQLGSIPKTLRA